VPFPDFSKPINFEEMHFVYFERLPKQFDEVLMQYDLAEFAYSTYQIKNAQHLENLLFVEELNAYVQLF
jgi:CRISPR-associated protein Cas5h